MNDHYLRERVKAARYDCLMSLLEDFVVGIVILILIWRGGEI